MERKPFFELRDSQNSGGANLLSLSADPVILDLKIQLAQLTKSFDLNFLPTYFAYISESIKVTKNDEKTSIFPKMLTPFLYVHLILNSVLRARYIRSSNRLTSERNFGISISFGRYRDHHKRCFNQIYITFKDIFDHIGFRFKK